MVGKKKDKLYVSSMVGKKRAISMVVRQLTPL